MLRNKAQFFSVDMIFALFILIFIIVAIYSFWDFSLGKTVITEKRKNIEIASRNALNVLIETEGVPSNWSKINISLFNESTINSLGLAKGTSLKGSDLNYRQRIGSWNSGRLILDEEKIQRLASLNDAKYSAIKNILGFSNNYEFELKIYKWNGTGYQANAAIGSIVESNSTSVVNLHRIALLNSTWGYINFRGWERCTNKGC